jgi:hypothetical protein
MALDSPLSPPVLDYRPTLAGAAAVWARRLRIGMLIAAILAVHLAALLIMHPAFEVTEMQGYLGGGVIGTPFSPITVPVREGGHGRLSSNDERVLEQYIPRGCAYLALFLVTQWWFLSPRGSWRIGIPRGGAADAEPLPRRAIIAAGFIGMLLCTGLIATILELPEWWTKLTTRDGIGTQQHFGIVWIVMAALWIFWSIVFWSYFASLDRYTALRKIFRRLLAGTMLEMFIAAPAHVWIVVRRGGDCYCERGTWTGVAFGVTAALWLFGPGALLLFLREKKRRETIIDTSPPSAAPAITSAT